MRNGTPDVAQKLQPRRRRYTVRYQVRLNVETYAKLRELAKILHRKHGQIVRHVMQWGLAQSKGWTIDQCTPASVHLVHVLVEPELMQQLKGAAAKQSASVAAWLREAMRQITRDDFPASWRAGETAVQSHESDYYHRKFQMRLDEGTSRKLARLTQTFHRSAADVIRQLVAQANPEDFPPSWQLAAEERRQRRSPSSRGDS